LIAVALSCKNELSQSETDIDLKTPKIGDIDPMAVELARMGWLRLVGSLKL